MFSIAIFKKDGVTLLLSSTFEGWATSLSAGESDWTYEFSFFKVNIDLTDAGHGEYF